LLTGRNAEDLAQSLKHILLDTRLLNFTLTQEFLEESSDGPAIVSSRAAGAHNPDLVVVCLAQSSLRDGKNVFNRVRIRLPESPIVVATATYDAPELCRLLDWGVADFVTPPFRCFELLPRLWRLRRQTDERDPVVFKLKEKLGLKQLIGESPALMAEIRKIPAVARCDAGVFIAGETGTGKEMFARAVHFLSPRASRPFVPVNCGALPAELFENELFGHEAGAFTGANAPSVGLLQAADGGSLFLDEVDSLPLLAQAKLLRFLQDKEFRRLGANKTCRADVRVIAASNANIEDAVRKGRFRDDLFFRLNVIAVTLPPLRERKEDIPPLARHFVAKYARAFDTPAQTIGTPALQKLQFYDWPGNIRELENVIERSLVLCSETVLGPEHIQLRHSLQIGIGESFQSLKAKMVSQFERAYLGDILREHGGNISKAAAAAGKDRRAFWELMRKHQISVRPRSSSQVSPQLV
jgi:DNA-binding NtrC family response regulator